MDWTKRELARIVDEHKTGKRSTDFPISGATTESPEEKSISKQLDESQAFYASLLKPNWLRMNNRVDLYEHFHKTWNLALRYTVLYEGSGRKNQMVQARVFSLLQVLKEIYERKGNELEREFITVNARSKKGTPEEAVQQAKDQWQRTIQYIQNGLNGFPQKN